MSSLGTLRLIDGQTTNGRWPKAKADPVGLLCPLAAHIRKVNPRETPNDLGASRASLDRRLLRRGLPYGEPLTDPAGSDPQGGDRGLLFVSYQTTNGFWFSYVWVILAVALKVCLPWQHSRDVS